MKNILLATTGLFGAALLATAASAATPKVTLGGFSDFQAGYSSDDNDANTRGTGFRNDNEISVHVDGVTDGGLGYGAVIDLEADLNNDGDDQGENAARTFTYLSGNWGKAEMGANKGAAATTRVDASTLAVATGGINGAWTNFVNNQAASGVKGKNTANFVTMSKLTSEHGTATEFGNESTYNATKITYYTPRFSGFQAGVSYTPDLNDRGQSINKIDRAANPGFFDQGDLIEGGINYENQFNNGVKLALSLTGETADADRATTAANQKEDLKAYALGGLVGYKGFSLAGSYGNWGDSGQLKTATSDDADYWTVGAGYEAGPFGLSATYLKSETEVTATTENEFHNLVIGADYKLAPGLTPYAEVSFYDFDQAGTGAGVYDNDGTAFILGTQVAF
jgi:outer membrane protein OmpU